VSTGLESTTEPIAMTAIIFGVDTRARARINVEVNEEASEEMGDGRDESNNRPNPSPDNANGSHALLLVTLQQLGIALSTPLAGKVAEA